MKILPAGERRAVTVEAVVDATGSRNPSGFTTAATARQASVQGMLPARDVERIRHGAPGRFAVDRRGIAARP